MPTLEYILNKYHSVMADRIKIPDAGRNDLATLLFELGFKTGVEVGVEHGFYSEVLCKANPQMKIYGVDPWESMEICKNNSADRRTQNRWSQARYNKYYEETKKRLSPYSNYDILREYSIDAVKKFGDETMDFVYIDGNHENAFVISDMDMWSKKVRRGGIVAGHDYYNTNGSSNVQLHVKQVVNDYVAHNNIKPLIIWKGDKWPTWMWIKT